MLLDRLPADRQDLPPRPEHEGRRRARSASGATIVDERGARAPAGDATATGSMAFLREKSSPSTATSGGPAAASTRRSCRELAGTIDAVVNVAGVVDFNPPLDEALHANAFGAQNLVALARPLGDAPALSTRAPATWPASARGPSSRSTPATTRSRARASSGASCGTPTARSRSASTSSRRPSTAPTTPFARASSTRPREEEPARKRGEPAHGNAFEEELAKEKRKFVERRAHRGGARPRDPLGLAQHLHVHQEHRRAGHRQAAGCRSPSPGPPAASRPTTFPITGWNEGINTSAPLMYLMMKGHVQVPARHAPLDFIPTDMVTAGMILALAELLEGNAKPVYQFGASRREPVRGRAVRRARGSYKRKHYQRRARATRLART